MTRIAAIAVARDRDEEPTGRRLRVAQGSGGLSIPVEDGDTARLVSLAQRGDSSSFEVLHDRYRGRVHGFLLRALSDTYDAEDATQEVFWRARRGLSDYRGEAPWRAWLFAIAQNCATERLRARANVDLMEPLQLSLRNEVLGSPLEAPAGPGWIGDDQLLSLFEQLPLPQRQVLTLRFALDRSVADTASILGRSVTDVTTLQHRAVRALRRSLLSPGPALRDEGSIAARYASVRIRPGLSPTLLHRRRALTVTL